MPPNTIDVPFGPESTLVHNGTKQSNEEIAREPEIVLSETLNWLNILHGSFAVIAHIIVGGIFTVLYLFAFRNGVPILSNYVNTHVLLCVTGYQLLMGEAILSMSSEGGWSSRLKLVHRRRIHWALQIAGSALAIGGTSYRISGSANHFYTGHGIFGLIAMIFTIISLINGVVSFYAYELRRFVKAKWVKIGHICCGVIAFLTANISLCLGIDKSLFRSWAVGSLPEIIIAFVSIYLFIVIVNPLISFYKKVRN